MQIPIKATGSTLAATEFNQLPDELQGLFSSANITPSSSDVMQTRKAIASYVANGTFYTDSGTVNSYILTTITSGAGTKQAVPSYQNGMLVRFKVGATNTGASTVNVSSLGVVDIVRTDGTPLTGGEMVSGQIVELTFDLASGDFFLTQRGVELNIISAQTATTVNIVIADQGKTFTHNATSGNSTYNLPTAASAGNGFIISVIKTDSTANIITIEPNAAETLNGFARVLLRSQGEGIIIKSDGTNWQSVSHWNKKLQVSIFTASGTFTVPDDTRTLHSVIVVGGGGGGGGAASAVVPACGGGGGGVGESYNIAVTPTAAITVTVGAGGAFGTGGTSAGVAGGASSFGAFITCTGGGGGGQSAGAGAGVGGISSGATINIAGSSGTSTFYTNIGGLGGGNRLGTGGSSGIGGVGIAGTNYGGGGGGGGADGVTPFNGGAGAAGVVIIEYYGNE
jgi:hypothetical protein